MQKPGIVTRRADGTSGGPLQLEHQERLIAHSPRPAEDALDCRVDGLDDAEADGMVAVGGEQLLELAPLGAAHALPAPQQQPPLPPPVGAHDRPGAKNSWRRTSSSAVAACCRT